MAKPSFIKLKDDKRNEIKLTIKEQESLDKFLTDLAYLISQLNKTAVYLANISDGITSHVRTLDRLESKVDTIQQNTFKEEKVLDDNEKSDKRFNYGV